MAHGKLSKVQTKAQVEKDEKLAVVWEEYEKGCLRIGPSISPLDLLHKVRNIVRSEYDYTLDSFPDIDFVDDDLSE